MKITRYQLITLAVISISTAMLFVDMTIFSVVLPAIQESLNATRGQSQWVVNIYLLVASILAFGAGRLSDMFGHRKIFSLGVFTFVASSLLCALSFNIYLLIAARALQAFGAAFILIAGMSLSADIFSDKDRGKANGIIMSVGSLAMVLSPFLGGLIIQFLNWHWVFLINVILGVFIFIPTVKLLLEKQVIKNKGSFDYLGFIIIALFTIAMTITCNNASNWGWLSQKSIIGYLCSMLAMAVFIAYEKNKTHPLIKLQLFSIVNYIPGCTILSLAQVTNYFIIFFGVYLQNALGYSAFYAGCLLLPAGILLATFSSIGGHCADKYGAQKPMIFGLFLLCTGFIITTLTIHTLSYFSILPALMGYGIGGCFLSNPLRTSMLRNTPKEYFGMSTAILSGVRQVGGVIGFAITGGIIVHVENTRAQILLLKQVPTLTEQKIHALMGILSNTPESQTVFLQFDTQTQVIIKNIVIESYTHSLYCALLLTSVALLCCFFISIFFVRSGKIMATH